MYPSAQDPKQCNSLPVSKNMGSPINMRYSSPIPVSGAPASPLASATAVRVVQGGSIRHDLKLIKARCVNWCNFSYGDKDTFRRRVAICASTGIAATHIEGTTIHSRTGCGVCEYDIDFMRMWGKKEKESPKEKDTSHASSEPLRAAAAPPVLRTLDTLLLDEISMISGEFLHHFDEACRSIRHRQYSHKGSSRRCNETEPFGGLQILAVGDFFQLPPVPGSTLAHPTEMVRVGERIYHPNDLQKRRDGRKEVIFNRGYAFQSRCWWEARFEVIELLHVYRQADKEFVAHLNSIRWGDRATIKAALTYFNTKACLQAGPCAPHAPRIVGGRPGTNRDDVLRLYPTNNGVDSFNAVRMAALPGEATMFGGEDFVEPFSDQAPAGMLIDKQCDDIRAGANEFYENLQAARSLSLKVNCKVLLLTNLDLEAPGNQKLVNGSVGQVVRWATCEEVDAKIDAMLEGVATEDAGTPNRTRFAMTSNAYFHKALETHLKSFVENNCRSRLPVVLFDNGREELIVPSVFRTEVHARGLAFRMQLPLRQAWALSIHKSQGMSLSQARIDTAKTFADGQVYVALSRVAAIDGLVLDTRLNRICTSPTARKFYEHTRQVSSGTVAATTTLPAFVILWENIPPKCERDQRNTAIAPGSRPVPNGNHDALAGQTFAVTGRFHGFDQAVIKEIIEHHGGEVVQTVRKSTNYLVKGAYVHDYWGNYQETSNKIDDAVTHNVRIIDEKALCAFDAEGIWIVP